jgi:hypothetical protein
MHTAACPFIQIVGALMPEMLGLLLIGDSFVQAAVVDLTSAFSQNQNKVENIRV